MMNGSASLIRAPWAQPGTLAPRPIDAGRARNLTVDQPGPIDVGGIEQVSELDEQQLSPAIHNGQLQLAQVVAEQAGHDIVRACRRTRLDRELEIAADSGVAEVAARSAGDRGRDRCVCSASGESERVDLFWRHPVNRLERCRIQRVEVELGTIGVTQHLGEVLELGAMSRIITREFGCDDVSAWRTPRVDTDIPAGLKDTLSPCGEHVHTTR